MRFKRVLLFRPAYKEGRYSRGSALHVGLGYMAEALHNNSIDYEVFDMTIGYSLEDFHRVMQKFRPDLVAMSIETYMFKRQYELIRDEIKSKYPEVKVLAGGPHISTSREKVMQECSDIDFGVTLEGDETIVELCKGKSPDEMQGIYYRKGRDIMYNGDKLFIQDLDNLPFPRYSKFEIEKYAKHINIASTRGCPYSCTFCSAPIVIGKKFRVRSPENVADEIEYWHNRGCRSFGFVDDNFTLYRQRVLDFCEEIKRRNLTGCKFECGNGVRADKVDFEMLKKMRGIGFYSLAFGVESGNNKVLKAIKKGETIEQIETGIKAACDAGIDVNLFFIFGSPGETKKDVEDTIKIALKYPVVDVRFYNIIPFRGTELYDWVEKNGYFLSNYDEYMNTGQLYFTDFIAYETPEMSRTDKLAVFRKTRRIIRIVHKRNFKRKITSPILANILGEILYNPLSYKLKRNDMLLNPISTLYYALPTNLHNWIREKKHALQDIISSIIAKPSAS